MKYIVGSSAYGAKDLVTKSNLNRFVKVAGIASIVGVFYASSAMNAHAEGYDGEEGFSLKNNSSYILNLNNSWTQPSVNCFCNLAGASESPTQTIAPGETGGWNVVSSLPFAYSWGVQYGVVIPGTDNIYSQYCTMNGDTTYAADSIYTVYGCTNNTPDNLLQIAFTSESGTGIGAYTFTDPPGNTPGSIVTPAVGPAPPVAPVPEPTSLALIAAGLIGFGLQRRRLTRQTQSRKRCSGPVSSDAGLRLSTSAMHSR